VKLTKCQNHHHHGDVFDMWTEWGKPHAEWAQGSAGRPNSLASQPGIKLVRPTTSWTRVYTRRGRPRRWRKAVGAIPPSWPAVWLGRLVTTWGGTTSAKSVELPHNPRNTPLRWKSEQTPHFENTTCKAPILSVVARRSLVGRVAGL
jgi:hypothetical protein